MNPYSADVLAILAWTVMVTFMIGGKKSKDVRAWDFLYDQEVLLRLVGYTTVVLIVDALISASNTLNSLISYWRR